MYTYNATITKVVDGDTVDLLVDLGFHAEINIRTRLLGLNAPEVKEQAGKDARDALRAKLPVGTRVDVQTFKDPGDKYGRWLAQIDAGDENINAWLIDNGYAVSYPV